MVRLRVMLVLVSLLVPFSAFADGVLETTTVDIVATRDTQVGAQLAVADAMGYFKQQGLDVKIHWGQSGDDVITLLGSGQVPVGCTSSFGLIVMRAQGADVRAIAGLADMAGTQGLALAPGVKLASPKDLVGKALAYTQGNPQILILAKMAQQYGFDASQIRLINMQPPEAIAAATNHDVAGILSFEPNLYRLVSLGGTMYATGKSTYYTGEKLDAAADQRLLYLNSTVVATEDWIATKPNTLKALIRAFGQATDLLASDRARAVEIIGKQVHIAPEALATVMAANSYSATIDNSVALSITYISDWALSIKRIPHAVTPESAISTGLLKSINPALVTWQPPT